MGITGTDVAKQTADMVLTDDNYASIVAAIEQGRIIYSNIRKFVYFLLACNVGEILIVFGAMLVGMPIPLRPVQLLWLNLVSDGAPALALGMEKGDSDIMKQPPRSPKEHVINRDMAIGIGVVGLVDALAILAVFFLALQRPPRSPGGGADHRLRDPVQLRAAARLHRAFGIPQRVAIGPFSNRWMVGAVAASFVLVMLVVYVPFLQPFFDTVPLTADDWLLMIPFFFVSPLAMELLKLYFRSRTAACRAQAGTGGPHFRPTRRRQQHGQDPRPRPRYRNCEAAIQHVIRLFMNNTALEIHLLNVQPPFRIDVARFVRKRDRDGFHREEAEKALRSCRERLDRFGIPYAVHVQVGDSARCITQTAKRLHCDHIVLATARKNTLTRLVEDSVTNRVMELTTVPVEVVAGEGVSNWERYGIPAAIAAVLALFLAAAE
jgi:Ca2+-transporting ATPase